LNGSGPDCFEAVRRKAAKRRGAEVADIDLAMARAFLAALSPDAEHTFLTFDDTGQKRSTLIRELHGGLAKHERLLASLNTRGAGVFVMINRGDLAGRKATNVVGCRAVFVDLDGAPVAPVLQAAPSPRIVVESSPGKWHCYWQVADMPLERFTSTQKELAARWAGDQRVHDRPRVMRLPGFFHQKGEPFLVRLDRAVATPFTWDELASAFNLTQRMVLPAVIPDGDRNDQLYKLARSACGKGVPESEQLKKLLKVNAERCKPPLAEAEVEGINASAYSRPIEGDVRVPYLLIDSPAFQKLSHGAQMLMVHVLRRKDSFNDGKISLSHKELAPWFGRSQTFYKYREELEREGFLELTQPHSKPNEGAKPKSGLYRLTVPQVRKSHPNEPPHRCEKRPLEALQVETLEGDIGGGPSVANSSTPDDGIGGKRAA